MTPDQRRDYDRALTEHDKWVNYDGYYRRGYRDPRSKPPPRSYVGYAFWLAGRDNRRKHDRAAYFAANPALAAKHRARFFNRCSDPDVNPPRGVWLTYFPPPDPRLDNMEPVR